MAGFNTDSTSLAQAAQSQSAPATDETDSLTASTTPQPLMSTEGDTALPDKVAYLPVANPASEFPIAVPPGAQTLASNTPKELEAPAQAEAQTQAEVPAEKTSNAAEADKDAAPAMTNAVYVTAGEMPAKPAEEHKPKKKSFLASLFGGSSSSGKAEHDSKVEAQPAAAKPIITLASAKQEIKPVAASVTGFTGDALPGVRRQTALFEITRKSGTDDDSDVDINEDEGPGLYQVASAAGMARLAPNGLLKQTESVDVACLKPSLVRVLKKIEAHYGKKMIVTSGYRDPARNRRARGARRSLHMFCAAADIQVPGVSKWELANYVRSMPGRGGVGTYCHTKSVHVDVGPERDWNWRCRRRK
ncbi:YcbK family protein [Manganibacter manganicus]|nr:YcbK family protein [Pseudaminobacter manganicus]